MPPLVEALDRACPGYVCDELRQCLAYPWMGGFVGHVVKARLAGRDAEVRAVFDIIEQEIARDGPDAELAIVGFLEDMQNGNLHTEGSRPELFEVYLGPQSRKRWGQLNGFWHAVDWNRRRS